MGQPPKCPEMSTPIFDQPGVPLRGRIWSPFDTGSKTPIQGFRRPWRRGPAYQGFQQAYRTTVSRVLRRVSQGNSASSIPAKPSSCRPIEVLRCGPRSPGHASVSDSPMPSWNPSEALPCKTPGWPPGQQTSSGPVSAAIGTKDKLRQYVAPLYTQEPSIRACLRSPRL